MCSDIKKLREITGAGILECKNALVASNGDLDQAVKHLRERGIASLNKRAGNKTGEGNFGFYEDGKSACLLELLSETDFVANSDVFKQAANDLAKHIANNHISSNDSSRVDGKIELKDIAPQNVLDVLTPLKENIKLGRFVRYTKDDAKNHSVIYNYIHCAGQNRVAAMVALSEECDKGRAIAVHIACNNPHIIALRPADISQAVIDEEMRFSTDEGEARAHTIEQFKKQSSLLTSSFIMDTSKTVGEILGDIKVLDFVRLGIGQ